MNERELILNCAQVNADYMRLPAGQLKGYEKLVKFYQWTADQSLLCAGAWRRDKLCPAHEPAVTAFWAAIIPWAQALGSNMGVDWGEWGNVFIKPHSQFVRYLGAKNYLERPIPVWQTPPTVVSPAAQILYHDVMWTRLVIKLTARWGLLYHLKDIPVLIQARKLMGELVRPFGKQEIETGGLWRRPPPPLPTELQHAYLMSDIEFFYKLFEPVAFSPGTRSKIEGFLRTALSN